MPKVQLRPAEPPARKGMTEDEIVEEMIAAEGRFMRSLRRSKKGNLWCKTQWGDTVTVFRSYDKWRWCVVSDDEEKEFSPHGYKTEDAAVFALWARVCPI